MKCSLCKFPMPENDRVFYRGLKRAHFCCAAEAQRIQKETTMSDAATPQDLDALAAAVAGLHLAVKDLLDIPVRPIPEAIENLDGALHLGMYAAAELLLTFTSAIIDGAMAGRTARKCVAPEGPS